MTKPAICRIDGILAREAPVAVIFRRGPSKQTQLLTWNLETDEVTPGQWIKAMVYTRRCDISPDGKHLIAAFTDYSSRRKNAVEQFGLKYEFMADGWTAISKPPYFTALALWFTGGAWNGGGRWEDRRLLKVNNDPSTWHEAISPRGAPFKVKKLNLRASEDEPIFTMRLERDGWRTASQFETRMTNRKAYDAFNKKFLSSGLGVLRGDFEEAFKLVSEFVMPEWEMVRPGKAVKTFAKGVLVYEKWLDPGEAIYDRSERWSILNSAGKTQMEFRPKPFHPQFLDVDPLGRLVFGDKGCLWAWKGFPDGKPKLIADLNGNRFEPVEAPEWARTW